VFTGIVERLGEVTALEVVGDNALVVTIREPAITASVERGDSVSVNGVCLTVSRFGAERAFLAYAMGETLDRTTLGALRVGDRVNLELAATPTTRLGGHIVQGHVDGVGEILSRSPDGQWELVRISLPSELNRYVVEKGSITVDGISLTVASVDETGFTVGLIPETLRRTTLGSAEPGTPVNLEVDVIAKYVERLVRQ
jgi:riboflavin synthase